MRLFIIELKLFKNKVLLFITAGAIVYPRSGL